MSISESENLAAFDRQRIAVKFELHRVFADIAEHSLMIIDRLAVAYDQNIAVGLQPENPLPFGCCLGRLLLQADVPNRLDGHLEHLAAGKCDLRFIGGDGVLRGCNPRAIHKLEPNRRLHKGNHRLRFVFGKQTKQFR